MSYLRVLLCTSPQFATNHILLIPKAPIYIFSLIYSSQKNTCEAIHVTPNGEKLTRFEFWGFHGGACWNYGFLGSIVCGYKHFERTCCLHLQGEGSIGLQNQVAEKAVPETHSEERNAKFLTFHISPLKTEAAYFIHTSVASYKNTLCSDQALSTIL
jgi:hypothetical protein